MSESRRLKNAAIFFQTILRSMLSRKIVYIFNDVARKHENFAVKDFRKYVKLKYQQNKLKLDINFLNNCKQLGLFPNFLIFKLTNI